MPLLTLEYSSNMKPHFDPKNYLLNMHVKLSKVLDANIKGYKSRSVCHDDFVIGMGGEDKAFVILTMEILPGRNDAMKARLGEMLSDELSVAVAGVNHFLNVQLSVHLKDISGLYLKNELVKLSD